MMHKLILLTPLEFKRVVMKVLNFIKDEFETNVGIVTELGRQEEGVQTIVKDD